MTGGKKKTDWKAEALALRAEVAHLRRRCSGLEEALRQADAANASRGAGAAARPAIDGEHVGAPRAGSAARPPTSLAGRDLERLDGESRTLLSTILETIPDAVYVKDVHGRHVLMNSAGAAMVGLSVDEVRGRDDAALFDAETALRWSDTDREIMAEGRSRTYTEWVMVRGDCRQFLTTKSPLTHADGRVAGVVGISRDVTELHRAADEMRRQKEVLQTVFDHIPIMISFMNARGQLEIVNRHWERILGWSAEEARREDVVTACYPDPSAREQVLSVLASPPDGWTDFHTQVRDERVIETSWQVVTLSDGRRLCFGQDITERKRTERALAEYAETVEAMSRRLFEVQERERRILARALHDDVGQLLIALRYALDSSTGPARPSSPTKAESALDRARGLVRTTLSHLQALSNRLHPELLDLMGLLPALRALFESLVSEGRLAVDFACGVGLDRRFATQIESTVYRFVEEAVMNVIRHAAVGEAAVRLWMEGDTLHVQVEDAGEGFDSGRMPAKGELSRMRERVRLLGGEFRLETAPGEGTHVMATLPALPEVEVEP